MVPLPRPSAVLFDLDGVLLDTEPLYTRATQAVVGEWGKVFDWSIKGDMIGRSSLDGARYLVKKLSLPIAPEEYLARRAPILDALFEDVGEIAGASAFVASLRGRLPLALATSSERRLYDLKVTRHPFVSWFDAVVVGDDERVKALKPAPDIFLVAAADLGVPAGECLVFEDSLAGVAAARAAGMRVVALPDAEMDRSRYGDADRVVAGWSEIDAADLGL